MRTITQAMGVETQDDAELVAKSLAGNRDAFGQIVARYQTLICSVAFSATGNLGQSEDLAQETFVAAWKQLGKLREPARLRSWLCQIARNLTYDALHEQSREPAQVGEPLDLSRDSAATEPLPPEQAMSREEEAILWRAIEKIPDTYREPLVLFYREHQSVERVALSLELTEDAVKQRLSRGRKMLEEQVRAFVEGALERSNPGKAFTLGVLAALPAFATSAQAATLAAGVVKGGAVAKSVGLVAWFSALAGIVVMFLGTYLGFRMDIESARSPQRRQFILKWYRVLVATMAVFFVAVLGLTFGGRSLAIGDPRLFAGLFIGLGTAYLVVVAVLAFWVPRSLRAIGQQEQIEGRPAPLLTPVFEYRSPCSLLGWPLVHIRLRGGLDRGPVRAWVAGGDAAIGLLFAFGGLAMAPISFGGLSLGLLTLGGFAAGILPFGGFSIGSWAIGGMAVGWQAFGGCAVAWKAAQGAIAVAHDLAVGAVALAPHANDGVAQAFMQDSSFFQNTLAAMRYAPWLNLLILVPLTLWWRHKRVQKRLNGGD